jgi:hypothetical protein
MAPGCTVRILSNTLKPSAVPLNWTADRQPDSRRESPSVRIIHDLHLLAHQATGQRRRVLAWREERTVTRNLTLHYDRMMLLLLIDPKVLPKIEAKLLSH